MAKVNLFFESLRDLKIEKQILNYDIIRLKCGVQLKTKYGWSQPYSAIIDTGAHTSVIPLSIWQDTIHEMAGDYKMFGISKRDEFGIIVKIGKVIGIIVDEFGNQSKELHNYAIPC